MGFPGSSVVNNPPANAGHTGDSGSIPGLGRSPGEGNSNPLQYSCLENPMDGGAWWAAIHGVPKSQTRLHFHFSLSCIGEGNGNPLVGGNLLEKEMASSPGAGNSNPL